MEPPMCDAEDQRKNEKKLSDIAEKLWLEGKTEPQNVTIDIKGRKYIKCITKVKPAAPPPPDDDDDTCICKKANPKDCKDSITGKKCVKKPATATGKDKDKKKDPAAAKAI
jgi:hypothetical protein